MKKEGTYAHKKGIHNTFTVGADIVMQYDNIFGNGSRVDTMFDLQGL